MLHTSLQQHRIETRQKEMERARGNSKGHENPNASEREISGGGPLAPNPPPIEPCSRARVSIRAEKCVLVFLVFSNF